MTVGIPGTGLGCVLYVLLCGWMAAREGWLMLRGRGSRPRMRIAMKHAAMAAAMVAALWVSVRVMGIGLRWVGDPAPAWRVGGDWTGQGGGLVSLTAMGIATGILAGVVMALRLLRLVVPRPPRPALPTTTAEEQQLCDANERKIAWTPTSRAS